MPDANRKNLPAPLEPIAGEYPEQTFYLAQVFNDTTNSYKLFWFKSIISLLKSGGGSIAVADIITEMVVFGWHPVCSFRLSLGRQDALQNAIQEIKIATGLPVR